MASPGVGLTARLSKLRAMSPREVLERLRYRAVIETERRQHRSGRLAHAAALEQALAPSVAGRDWQRRLLESRRAHRTRFLPGVASPDRMRALFATEYRAEHAATRAEAELARQHRFEFFGQRFEYGDSIPWQSDPVTGNPWPARYHADVPVHRGDVGAGDVKHVWELSRQQYLIDLGKAYFLDGDAADYHAVRDLVRSWIAGNPYATGVNWSCALEPAFRVFSWLWAYYFTADALDDQFHLEWLQAFHDHASFIDRHLEHYSSPYNHLIGEATALYMLGACFPEFRRAAAWRSRARRVLAVRLGEQFYPDGGSVEQSTFYHHATTGFYLLATLTARAVGEDMPPAIVAAIERGLDYSQSLLQPNGYTPEIGGADDGKPIRLEHLPFWDFRPYLAIGAVLFGRGDFKASSGRFYEDALWLLGPDGLDRYQSLPSKAPAASDIALRGSGYYVLRSDWSPSADYVCVDCGEQAAGMRTDAVPNSMHGHADCLSVIAWLNGRRVLVDSGLFAYNCGGDWEAHFRETAAHNTARIDGADQARHIGKMAWSHSYRAAAEQWHPSADECWFVGSHDGYARGPQGVTHRRAVWRRPDHYLVIADEFVGSGQHEIEVNYQFAPGTLQPLEEGVALFDGAVDIAWLGNTRWRAEIKAGGAGPRDGWIAPSLGVRHPAPRLVLRGAFEEPRTTLVTVIAARVPASDALRLSRGDAEPVGAAAAVIERRGYTDVITGASIGTGFPLTTDGLVTIARLRDGRAPETGRIGGTLTRIDGDALGRLLHGSARVTHR